MRKNVTFLNQDRLLKDDIDLLLRLIDENYSNSSPKPEHIENLKEILKAIKTL